MRPTFGNWYDRKMRANEEISKKTDQAEALLDDVSTIAIVGISSNPQKDSNFVGRYLKNAGYRIVPVNPGAKEILGEKAYASLDEIPFPVDVVDIFRKPEAIPSVVKDALNIQPKAIWLQLGTGTHNDQQNLVEKQGIQFYQNRCIKADHQFLIRPKQS